MSGSGEVLRLTAVVNLREALELYFEDEPVPRPVQPIVAPIEVRISA